MRIRKTLLAAATLCVLLGTLAAPAAAASAQFRDVPDSYWAAPYIRQVVEAGLLQGEDAGFFGVGNPMTRGDFVVALCRLFGWETVTPEKGSFEDNQDPSSFCYSAVETALANGAITAQVERFRPDDAITREEMAVMLVRSLGYTTLAGLDLKLENPFTDVDSNQSYVALACRLGISGGTSATTFSPDRPATREQAAVMLARVRERLMKDAPERIGIYQGAGELSGLDGYGAVSVATARLVSTGAVTGGDGEGVGELREDVRSAGGKALLRVLSSKITVEAEPETAAASVAEAARDFDGVLLDIPNLPGSAKRLFTPLVQDLRNSLGDKLLYVVADMPAAGDGHTGYDCAALSAIADRLILRVPSYNQEVNGFPILPQEPLEEVYYTLATLKDKVDLTKCSLWLTTTGTVRTEDKTSSVLTGRLQALLADKTTKRYYSLRYADAYITTVEDNKDVVAWFHDARAAEARVRLCAFFGVESVCLSDMASLSADPDASLLPGLGPA